MKKIIFLILICFPLFTFISEVKAAEMGVRSAGWDCEITKEELVWNCYGTCEHCQNESACKFEKKEESSPCRVGWLNNNPECACCGNCQLDDVLWMAVNVANIILRYVAVIALVFFVIGGIIWITSGGAKNQIDLGKKIVKGALIGLLIILFAHLIISEILTRVETEPGYQRVLTPSPTTKKKINE